MPRTIIWTGLALLLTACSSAPPEYSLICPTAGILKGGDTIVLTADGATSKAAFGNYRGGCRPGGSGIVDFVLDVDFIAARGSAGAGLRSQEFPYFIAVLSPGDEILQRQAFSTRIEFDSSGQGRVTEAHEIRIPVAAPETLPSYKITMGFVLPEQQIDVMSGNKATMKKTGKKNGR